MGLGIFGTAIALQSGMSSNTSHLLKEIRTNSSGDKNPFPDFGEEVLSLYAWLEQDQGLWHFLTTPFADPVDSMRKWNSKHEALDELNKEGWSIVRPYQQEFWGESGSCLCGYGLKRTLH